MTMSGGRIAPLLTPGRRDQYPIPREPNGKIAVHGGHEPALVQHASVVNDFFPVFAFRRHGYLCLVTLGREIKAGRNLGIRILSVAPSSRQSKFQ